IVLAGLVAVVLVGTKASILERTPFELPPDVLAQRARDLIHKLGYTQKEADRAWGFSQASTFKRYGERSEKPEVYQSQISRGQPSPVYFWYREASQPLTSWQGASPVTATDPPLIQ